MVTRMLPKSETGAEDVNRQQAPYTVEVVTRVEAARDAVTLWLAVPGMLRAPAPYLPGQFITLTLPTSGGRTLARSYSLCGDGGADRPWEITVKRQEGGAVSPFLLRAAQPGMRLHTSAPQGVFTLPRQLGPQRQLVFVALGSGITPIYSMVRAIASLAPDRRLRVALHYAYHSPADAIYGRELAALDPQRRWLTQWRYVSTEGNRIGVAQVLARSAATLASAEWYVCGPADFKRALEAELTARDVAPARMHAEVFASPRSSASVNVTASATRGGRGMPGSTRVRLAETGRVLEGRPGETLLEILERSGCHPDYSCRAGACGTCRLRLLAGDVHGGTEGALSAQERAAGYVLSCQARPVGEVTLAGARATSGALIPAAGARQPSRARRAGRTAMRSGLVAASVALFASAWTLAGQASATSASAQSSSSPATATATPCDSGDLSSSCATLPSGSSSITTQPTATPTPTAPSTSSGASR